MNLVNQLDLKELINKTNSSFTLQNVMRFIIFEIDTINNQTSINYTFDFKNDGKINKEINSIVIKLQLDLNEIEQKVNCTFTINENKNSSLIAK